MFFDSIIYKKNWRLTMIKFVVVQDGKPIEPKNPSGGKGKEKDVGYKGRE